MHTYIYSIYYTDAHIQVCVCSILSAKVQQQNALEIKKGKQIIQTQEKKQKQNIYILYICIY